MARGLPPKASQCRIASWPDLSTLLVIFGRFNDDDDDNDDPPEDVALRMTNH